MKGFYVLKFLGLILITSCSDNSTISQPNSKNSDINTSAVIAAGSFSGNTYNDSSSFIFKEMVSYKFTDELGNNGEYEINYSPESGVMYVSTNELIPMIDGILIFPDATYKILGKNESGKDIALTFKNDRDISVKLSDEPDVTYPQPYPYINYQLNEGSSLVYKDGVNGSADFIKSKLYVVAFEGANDHINLHITDNFPKLNSRLLYGLSALPGDVGLFFKPFSNLWTISSLQWPTVVSGKDYSTEMTAYGYTDCHVDLGRYLETKTVTTY